MRPSVGFILQPEGAFLELLADLILEDCEHLVVMPETCWRSTSAGFALNGFGRRFAALHEHTGLPMIGHGVGWSVGTPGDEERRRAWRARLAEDQRIFHFLHYSDHLGESAPGGLNQTLPGPIPPTPARAQVVRDNLAPLDAIFGCTAVENTVTYTLGHDWQTDAAFLAATDAPIVLDLHNAWTMARNHGASVTTWLARVPLDRVLEIHVSGGAEAPAHWGVGPLRLDSHDTGVPDEVWTLLDEVGPRCVNLRALTLERMEGTVTAADVEPLRAELARLHSFADRWAPVPAPAQPPPVLPENPSPAPQPAHARVAALLVARLRFERLIQGCAAANQASEADPAAFARAFAAYHAAVPPTAWLAQDEARLWADWQRRQSR